MFIVALSVALAAAPGSPEARSEVKAHIQNLEQLLSDWDVEGAAAELTRLEALAPPDLGPVAYYQGRVAFEQGRYDEAVERLEKAGDSDKVAGWLALARQTRGVVGDFEKKESEHFIFTYPRGKDAVLVPWALDALEAIRAALEQDLGYAPPGKVRVEIVANASELSRVSTLSREAIRTTGTIAICKFNKLMVTTPRAVLKGYDWMDTLAHEYVHLVVSRKSRNTVPIWLHEGLAKYLESRWRGPAGGAMTPSTLALLGSRVRAGTLVPFEKMHPSMALLPTAEDAATAFAEVFFAVQLIHKQGGPAALSRLLTAMGQGSSEKAAVEQVTGKKWAEFERAWMDHLRRQPYPKGLIPLAGHEKKQLKEGATAKKDEKKTRDISFGDFREVAEVDARKSAHLGELFRERRRMKAAADAYARAHAVVGDRYESVSNKYALTLLELGQHEEAEKVLEGSLSVHPGSPSTNVHLGRIRLKARAYPRARAAYQEAMAVNPFDPEVHVALYAIATATRDQALRQRALDGARTLLKLEASEVDEVARRFAELETLAEVDLDGAAPDAGR